MMKWLYFPHFFKCFENIRHRRWREHTTGGGETARYHIVPLASEHAAVRQSTTRQLLQFRLQ